MSLPLQLGLVYLISELLLTLLRQLRRAGVQLEESCGNRALRTRRPRDKAGPGENGFDFFALVDAFFERSPSDLCGEPICDSHLGRRRLPVSFGRV